MLSFHDHIVITQWITNTILIVGGLFALLNFIATNKLFSTYFLYVSINREENEILRKQLKVEAARRKQDKDKGVKTPWTKAQKDRFHTGKATTIFIVLGGFVHLYLSLHTILSPIHYLGYNFGLLVIGIASLGKIKNDKLEAQAIGYMAGCFGIGAVIGSTILKFTFKEPTPEQRDLIRENCLTFTQECLNLL